MSKESKKNAAIKDLAADAPYNMFDYLMPEDIDPNYGGGKRKKQSLDAFRVGVVGVGVMGQVHIKYQMEVGQGTVAAIADVRERSVQTALRLFDEPEKVTVHDSAEALCADPNIDAVIIATPNFTHREVFDVAIRHGKAILLEKPMTTTIEDAWAVVQAVKHYEQPVMVGLEYRLKPMYLQAAHELFDRRSLGDLKQISILEHRGSFLNKAGQWNKFAKYSGGTLVEKCCHYFDQFNYLSQSRPRRVFASGNMAVNFKDFVYKGESSDILDNALVIVEYENDIRASLNLCMFSKSGHLEEIILVGDQGRLHGKDGVESEIELHTDLLPSYKQQAHWTQPGSHSGASPAQARLFADVMRGKTDRYPTVLDGFWSVVVGVATERSVATGQPVEIAALLRECGVKSA